VILTKRKDLTHLCTPKFCNATNVAKQPLLSVCVQMTKPDLNYQCRYDGFWPLKGSCMVGMVECFATGVTEAPTPKPTLSPTMSPTQKPTLPSENRDKSDDDDDDTTGGDDDAVPGNSAAEAEQLARVEAAKKAKFMKANRAAPLTRAPTPKAVANLTKAPSPHGFMVTVPPDVTRAPRRPTPATPTSSPTPATKAPTSSPTPDLNTQRAGLLALLASAEKKDTAAMTTTAKVYHNKHPQWKYMLRTAVMKKTRQCPESFLDAKMLDNNFNGIRPLEKKRISAGCCTLDKVLGAVQLLHDIEKCAGAHDWLAIVSSTDFKPTGKKPTGQCDKDQGALSETQVCIH
jgi:hypothetical protein